MSTDQGSSAADQSRELKDGCTFCEIIAGREPAEVLHEDEELIVFRNQLRWVPVMLLIVPKRHLSQAEMWRDLGRVGALGLEVGQQHCPQGFRLLSNFGREAMQSQAHGHLHVIGGTQLGRYV
jgi:histidine triad (HIT) family protein